MQWLILQLTPWAVKTKRTKELQASIKGHPSLRKLEFYYPTPEDQHGKYDLGFGEYAFLEYREGIDYSSLENTEDFVGPLRGSPESPPQVVDNSYVTKIQQQIKVTKDVQIDDIVMITVGALQGNTAKVEYVNDEEKCASLAVDVGHEVLDACLPVKWLKVIRSGDVEL